MIQFIRNFLEERERVRDLNRKLEGLTNHLFFIRYEQDKRGEL